MNLRPLTTSDLDWLVDHTRARRERLAPDAPRFWRPAADAPQRLRAFLAHLVDEPGTLSIRTDQGYLIALDRGDRWLVDDMDVPEAAWPTDGVRLLGAVLDGAAGRRVRLVVPTSEHARRRAAEALGLVAVETWWHRDLPVTRVTATVSGLKIGGTVGRLVPAPPVYDPGGPVLLVTAVDTAPNLARLEAEATAGGATVAVVSQRPDDVALDHLLTEAGYLLTTCFYESVGAS